MQKKISALTGLIALCFTLKLLIINYGLPFQFHPDEVGILKDPVRLLLKYKELNFSSPTSLFNWLFLIWDFFVFLFGLIIGKWHNIAEFQAMFVAEDTFIILASRTFSIVLSLTAQLILLKLGKLIFKKHIFFMCFALAIIFNPIELISNVWIKFDPLCYIFHSALLFYFYKYFILNEEKLKSKLILLCFLGLSVRIEFIAHLVCVIGHELMKSKIPPKKKLQELFYPSIKGIALYSIITLYPLSLFYNETTNLSTQRPYEEVIFERYSATISSGEIFNNILNNTYFYLYNFLFISIGPLICCITIFWILKEKQFKIFIWLLLLLIVPVLLYVIATPHYILGVSVLFIFLSSIGIYFAQINFKLKSFISIFNALYVVSIGLQVVYCANNITDPRLTGRTYLLENSKQTDTIAIEGYLCPGLYAPIEECPDVLLEKSIIVQRYKIGTGETFRLKSQKPNANCRNVLEVWKEDRFSGTPNKGEWINTYDTLSFPLSSITFFSSIADYTGKGNSTAFSAFINNNFILDKHYSVHFFDKRLYSLLPNDGFFFSSCIYKNKRRV